MKFFLKISIIIVFVFLLANCDKNDEMEQISTDAPCFSLSVKDIGPVSVSIQISHTGSNRDEYYTYLDVKPQNNVDLLIDSLLSHTVELDKLDQRKRVVTVNYLLPETNYRFIVFSVDENNHLYGTPCSITFTTSDVDIDMSIEPSWQINWIGEAFHDGEYYTHVQVKCDNISEPFYSCLVSDSVFNKLDQDIARIALYKLSEAAHEAHDNGFDNILAGNMISHVSSDNWFYRSPGYFYFMVIGVDEKGMPSGKYNISKREVIDAYTMLPDYEQFLGKWRLTDKAGVTANINVIAEYINRSYKVEGWANKNLPITIFFDCADAVSKISMQRHTIAQNIAFTNNQDNSSFLGDLRLEAWYINSSGKKNRAETSTSKLATCIASSKDRYVIDASFYNTGLEDSDSGLYYAILVNGIYRSALENSFYTFPITLNRR